MTKTIEITQKIVDLCKETQDGYKHNMIDEIIDSIGVESVADVANHGADGGFSGFIYTRDTCEFYQKYRIAIRRMLKQDVEDFGTGDTLNFVKSFNCLDDETTIDDIAEVIFGTYNAKDEDNDAHDTIANALAWYALESVCREINDFAENLDDNYIPEINDPTHPDFSGYQDSNEEVQS